MREVHSKYNKKRESSYEGIGFCEAVVAALKRKADVRSTTKMFALEVRQSDFLFETHKKIVNKITFYHKSHCFLHNSIKNTTFAISNYSTLC